MCKDEGNQVPAVMFCASCGKAICEDHATEGRYCSTSCYEQQAGERQLEEATDHSGAQEKRKRTMMIGGIVVFVVVAAIVYYVLTYVV